MTSGKRKLCRSVLAALSAVMLTVCGCSKAPAPAPAETADTASETPVQETDTGSSVESDEASETARSTAADPSGETADTAPEETTGEPVQDKGEPAWEEPVLSEKELYEEMSKWSYDHSTDYSSWMTSIKPCADGSFDGEAYDFRMVSGFDEAAGDGIDAYNYNCVFHGHFTGAKRIGPYTYEVGIGDISYETEPGTEGEVTDGVKDVACEAYGLDGVGKITVYLPGINVKDTDKEYLDAIQRRFSVTVSSEDNCKEDIDTPEDLYFSGIWAEDTKAFFCSAPNRGNAGNNLIYLRNRAVFPGLHNDSYVMNPDGTYDIRDVSSDRGVTLANICIPVTGEDMELVDYLETATAVENEALGKYCAKAVTGGGEPEDLMFYESGGMMSGYIPDRMYMNGLQNMYMSWRQEKNGDMTDHYARIQQYEGYLYIYDIGIRTGVSNMIIQAANRFLTSVTFTGRREKLSNDSPDKEISWRFGFVNGDFEKGTKTGVSLAFDEGEIVSGEDTDKLKEYGIDPEAAGDFEIVGQDGNYERYDVADYCPVYLDTHYADVVYGHHDTGFLMDIKGGTQSWTYGSDDRDMYILMNDKNEIVFMFEMEDV